MKNAENDLNLQKLVEHFFATLGIEGTVEATQVEDEVHTTLQTKDSGMVIGYHGEGLEALQIILSLYLSKKLGVFIRVSLEVGDYKKNRTGWLENLAAQAKEKALSQNEEVPLTNLKSWERRVVHMILQDDESVISESVGEGKDRTLVIKPKQ